MNISGYFKCLWRHSLFLLSFNHCYGLLQWKECIIKCPCDYLFDYLFKWSSVIQGNQYLLRKHAIHTRDSFTDFFNIMMLIYISCLSLVHWGLLWFTDNCLDTNHSRADPILRKFFSWAAAGLRFSPETDVWRLAVFSRYHCPSASQNCQSKQKDIDKGEKQY